MPNAFRDTPLDFEEKIDNLYFNELMLVANGQILPDFFKQNGLFL